MRNLLLFVPLSFCLSTAAIAATTSAAGTNTTGVIAGTSSTTLMTTANTATLPSTNSTSVVQTNAPAPKALTALCPATNQLIKDTTKLTWSAPGGWQSYQQSFSNSIVQFTGVQWAGIKVGQIICTYKGSGSDTFPIQLVYDKLVFEPSGNSWGQNMGGYINCKSTDINDCPFNVQLTQRTDIFKEAESIQPTPPQEQAF